MAIALQGVRDERERHGEHRSPGTANHQERDELQILVTDERYECKADTTDHQTDGISHLCILELWQQGGPDNRAHGLNGKEDTHPVTCLLEGLTGRIGRVPHHLGDGTGRIVPHIEHGCPAEELHESHLPERRGGILQQGDPIGTLFFLLRNGIIFGIVLRIPLLHFRSGINDTENQDGCTDIERPNNTVGHHTFLCHIADADKCKDEREHKAQHRTGIAEERLDGVGLGLLLLVHHVTYEHLKRLHRHIDTGVEEHQGNQSEHHGGTDRQSQ